MNSLLSPSSYPTSLVSDSCRLDKGLIIPWICQALTSPMSSCDWCTDSGASPAKNPTSRWGLLLLLNVWMCVCISMVPLRLQSSPYGVLGLKRPSSRMPAQAMVVAWLGSVELWLARERSNARRAAPSMLLAPDVAFIYCFPSVRNEETALPWREPLKALNSKAWFTEKKR